MLIHFFFTIFLISSYSFAAPPKPHHLASFKGTLWSFSFINKNEVLVSLREGQLYHFNIQTKQKKKLKSPKATTSGQGGLLDVHYLKRGNTQYVYFTFSEVYKDILTTSLARGVYKNNNLSEIKTLFRAKVNSDTSRHFGSRLLFKDNFIFMTIGDRGERKYAQDLAYHNGKILRLTLDGQPAPGNPYTGKAKTLAEIWSFGHRNPQGIDLDPVTKKVYSVEFGPRGGDELNLIQKGINYGWPTITYGKEYYGPRIGDTHKKGLQQPIIHWTPSISPSGMTFYNSDRFPLWKNNLFVAALGSQHLRRLKVKDGEVISQEKLFDSLNERIRHVRTSPDGYLYFSTDSGKLMKVM